jgi:hypothetical protein
MMGQTRRYYAARAAQTKLSDVFYPAILLRKERCLKAAESANEKERKRRRSIVPDAGKSVRFRSLKSKVIT